MLNLSPIIKMTLGLTMLTVSLILVADMLGIIPNKNTAKLEVRKQMSETLAIHIAKAAENNQGKFINILLEQLVKRNDDILSIALVKISGRTIASVGDHNILWEKKLSDKKSTPSHIQVPILSSKGEWGRVQIRFTDLADSGLMSIIQDDFVLLILFIMLSGFFIYRMFLKRTLRYLDPSAAIPDRVKGAMDVMTDAILILDQRGQIIFINAAFPMLVDIPASSLLGKKASQLKWEINTENSSPIKGAKYPWERTLAHNETYTNFSLTFVTPKKVEKSILSNSSPVQDHEGKARGAIVTFVDVTQKEKQTNQLRSMVAELKTTQTELEGRNIELSELASKDPLTGCMNRRSFFEQVEERLKDKDLKLEDVSCMMFDIDHFKSVNDNYGHAVGDRVIRDIAETTQSSLRDTDLLCRYGGEEFCIFMDKTNYFQGAGLAERIRTRISLLSFKDDPNTVNLKVTTSFGVSDFKQGAKSFNELLEQADTALYSAKNNGRNCVMRWNQKTPDTISESEEKSSIPVVQKKPNKLLQGFYDDLTGLPGRTLFIDALKQLVVNKQKVNDVSPFAVLLVDIDAFKRINTSLGHTMGDALIQAIGQRIPNIIRQSDYSIVGNIAEQHKAKVNYARLGGDEFGFVLQHFSDKDNVVAIVERISKSLNDTYKIQGQDIHITVSIGITVYPSDGDSAEHMLKNAEIAMYYAKNLGGNTHAFYSEGIGEGGEESIRFEHALHNAIENNEFILHYQPKVDLTTGKIMGMEALIRWVNSDNEMIPPGRFIEVAEKSNLINEIGNWTLKEGCRQTKIWVEKGFKDIVVSINLSAKQFLQVDFSETLKGIVLASGVNPKNIELEVTENILMENIDDVIPILKEFSDLGMHISVDDFGVGYSSLSYISRFPLDTIKIDRSFVTDIVGGKRNDNAIISAIVAMAHAMKLKVIAEGVETEEQLNVLRKLKCDQIQGYFFSKPIAADKMLELLKSGKCLSFPDAADSKVLQFQPKS